MRLAGFAVFAAALTVSAAVQLEMARAQISDDTVKIGVMNDMSGLYADISGQGSVEAARMAIADFGGTVNGKKIELVSADHQNKPDVGGAIARQWYDNDKVDAIVDVPTSSVALAVQDVARERKKVFLISGAASSDLTGKACSPTGIHWTYDTVALANGTGSAVVKAGGDTWFFITADYASACRSTPPISPPICCRRRPRRRRSSVSPMPAATRSIRSSSPPSSAWSKAARKWPASWSSSPTSTASA